jgi:hypothetical protein
LVGVPNEDERLIRPDGLAIRGLRHTRGWSLRDLSAAISEAHESATGLPVRLRHGCSRRRGRNALISYATLCWIGSGSTAIRSSSCSRTRRSRPAHRRGEVAITGGSIAGGVGPS